MLEESAQVVKIENGVAWVVGTASACHSCAQKSGCTSNALASVLKKKPVPVDSEIRLAVGDTVTVAIEEGVLLRAAFSMYLLPLLALFLGVGITDSLLSADTPYADLWLAASALGSLALALALIAAVQRRLLFSYYARPSVVKKC
jgi:sigma-E factor negative regulatory protein RseC